MSVQDPFKQDLNKPDLNKKDLNKPDLNKVINTQPLLIGSFLNTKALRSLVSVSKKTRNEFLNNPQVREQLEARLLNACNSNDCFMIGEVLAIEPRLINIQEKSNGYTPIMVAIIRNHIEAFNLLCKYNPDLTILLDGNQSALWFAAGWCQWQFVTQLIKMGARNFDECPVTGANAGISAFWRTVDCNQLNIAMEMINLGAKSFDQAPLNHNHYRHFGSALMIASSRRQWDLVQKMIEKGARGFDQTRTLKTDCGATPLWYAIRDEQWKIGSLMVKFGAKNHDACPKEGAEKGLTVSYFTKHFAGRYEENRRTKAILAQSQLSLAKAQLSLANFRSRKSSKQQIPDKQPLELIPLERDPRKNRVLEALQKKYDEEQALISEMEEIYQKKCLSEYYHTFLKNFYNSIISANIEHNKIHSNSLSNFSQGAKLLKTGAELTESFEVGFEAASHIIEGAFKECLTGSVLRLGMTAIGSLLKVVGLSEKNNCINNIVNYISDPGSILPLCQILAKELTLKQKDLLQDMATHSHADDHPKSFMSNLKHLLLSSHDVPTDINSPIKKLAYIHCLNILHAIMIGKLKPVNHRFNLLSFHFSTSPVNYRTLAEDLNPTLLHIIGNKEQTQKPKQEVQHHPVGTATLVGTAIYLAAKKEGKCLAKKKEKPESKRVRV